MANAFPVWQDKCIELVSQVLGSASTFDTKAVAAKMEKSEMKKAMPFIQGLKKRIDGGEPAAHVLDRRLAFDELATLKEMVPSLKQTLSKLKTVQIVSVKEGETTGQIVEGGGEEKTLTLPPQAGSATPGNPTFHFENVAN